VRWAIEEKNYSQRRACGLVGIDPKTYRYRPRCDDDGVLRTRLKDLAAQRRRFGYRRLHLLIAREGVTVNHKKLYRIYREEKLVVGKRGGRKRALGTRAPMAVPQGPNQRWSIDFVADTIDDGRRFRVLGVVDDFTRECVALIPDTSLSGKRVARELDAAIAERGRPALIVSDNGTEFTSTAMLALAAGKRRRLALHPAGQADPERLHRVVQRPAARRTAQRDRVPLAGARPRADRRMARGLQSLAPPHEPRRAHASRVQSPGRRGPNPERTLVMTEGKMGAGSAPVGPAVPPGPRLPD
jgi:transposase InsO family protein